MVSSYLVGEMIKAPTSFDFNLFSLRIMRSMMGMTNARVFPDPVTALTRYNERVQMKSARHVFVLFRRNTRPTSTTTSLFFMKSGIVLAWTGVIF